MKDKIRISDRKYKVYKETCQHELNLKGTKVCGKPLDEDTGQCPKGHGGMKHGCATLGCIVWVGGNHKFCIYHRKSKLKDMDKINKKITREYRLRMGWTKKQFTGLSIDTREGKEDFNNWARKEREKTFDPEVLKQEKLLEQTTVTQESQP